MIDASHQPLHRDGFISPHPGGSYQGLGWVKPQFKRQSTHIATQLRHRNRSYTYCRFSLDVIQFRDPGKFKFKFFSYCLEALTFFVIGHVWKWLQQTVLVCQSHSSFIFSPDFPIQIVRVTYMNISTHSLYLIPFFLRRWWKHTKRDRCVTELCYTTHHKFNFKKGGWRVSCPCGRC
jgi:hypothetical protein